MLYRVGSSVTQGILCSMHTYKIHQKYPTKNSIFCPENLHIASFCFSLSCRKRIPLSLSKSINQLKFPSTICFVHFFLCFFLPTCQNGCLIGLCFSLFITSSFFHFILTDIIHDLFSIIYTFR